MAWVYAISRWALNTDADDWLLTVVLALAVTLLAGGVLLPFPGSRAYGVGTVIGAGGAVVAHLVVLLVIVSIVGS